MSENAVAGTVRVRSTWSMSSAARASAARAAVIFTTTRAPSAAGESVELPIGMGGRPSLRTISMPLGSNADASMYSSNSIATVPASRSRTGAVVLRGGVVSPATVTPKPGAGTYQPRLPAG